MAFSAKEAFSQLQKNSYNLVICDIRMPDMGGISLLSKIGGEIPVIMITAYASVETARKAFKLGAQDYLTKPFKFDELLVMVKQFMADKLSRHFESPDILIPSKNEKYNKVLGLAKKFSATDLPILITGESGTGKEFIADYIYNLTKNTAKSYIKINCAAIPEALLEGELFGYEKGAFTGAVSSKIGKVEEADGGVLFLDEIGDMPLLLQAKMLRILQDFKVTRLGSNKQFSVNTRIIAASNHNLEVLVEKRQFRLDLYHRLKGVLLKIPPLRERTCDISELSYEFLDFFNKKYDKHISSIHDDVFKVFLSYSWPGNIRELKYCIERATVVCENSCLTSQHLPDSIHPADESIDIRESPETFPQPLKTFRNEYMRKFILQALEKTNGNKLEAAKILNISRKTLYNRIKELDIRYEFS